MDVGVFASLCNDHQQVAKVTLAIEAAVTTSFVQDEQRGGIIVPSRVRITQSETKERGKRCIRIFRILRGDMKWSWQRCVDHLPIYLRKELDGEDWEPAARASWTPSPNIE